MSTSDHGHDRKDGHRDGHGQGDRHEHAGGRHMTLADAELDSTVTTPPVLDGFWNAVQPATPKRILDLGCGPGVATIAFANKYPSAIVIGIDLSEETVELAAKRADEAGVADRVSFLAADFGDDLKSLVEPVDSVWASMSMHHTSDPAEALDRACAMLTPGGRLTLAEFGQPVNLWADTAPVVTDGVWNRWQGAWAEALEDHLGPEAANIDWPALFANGPLTEVQQLEVPISFPAPLQDRERQWMSTHLRLGLQINEDRLSVEDTAVIEGLLDSDNPVGLVLSSEVFVHSTRMIYTGVLKP